MQKTLSLTRLFMVAALSCSLVLAGDGSNIDFTYADTANVIEGSDMPTPNSVWADLGAALNLDHQDNTVEVQAQIHGLLANQHKFNHILAAATPYIYYIYTQTEARGLPAEIALIPFIESEFNPNDHSTKGATGLWQIMPETAHELGLKVKQGYDGRRDLVASTKAALAYFNDLGNDFKGNWYLAIGAYNCGQGAMQSAERRAGSDYFWSLHLPSETKSYVPKLLAVAAIIKNPEKYGVELPTVKAKPYFANVKTRKSHHLVQLAKASAIHSKTYQLNAHYMHGVLPPKKETYALWVPAISSSEIKAKFATATHA